MYAAMFPSFFLSLGLMLAVQMEPQRMLLIYAVLAALAFVGYLIVLGPVSRLLWRRREQVLGRLESESRSI